LQSGRRSEALRKLARSQALDGKASCSREGSQGRCRRRKKIPREMSSTSKEEKSEEKAQKKTDKK
jgi:hypothetical protein